jgi:hypothetical protein
VYFILSKYVRCITQGFNDDQCWWLTPVIPATKEAEIRRIEVQSQLGQIVQETLCGKNPSQKKRGGGVAQVVGPEFKLQVPQKKKTSGIGHQSSHGRQAWVPRGKLDHMG